MTLARDLKISVVEKMITRDELYIADEVFITGTAAELVPVREVDTRRVADGCIGPITQALQKSFYLSSHGSGSRSDEWLDYVN